MFVSFAIFVLLGHNLVVGLNILPSLLGQLPLDGRAKDIVILDQRQLVNGKMLCQMPAVKMTIVMKVMMKVMINVVIKVMIKVVIKVIMVLVMTTNIV